MAFVLSGVAASHRPVAWLIYTLMAFPSTERTDGRRVGLFYLSEKQLALFFETEPADTHKFGLLVFNAEGEKTAEISISGNPKALDITAGPSGGVSNHLDITTTISNCLGQFRWLPQQRELHSTAKAIS